MKSKKTARAGDGTTASADRSGKAVRIECCGNGFIVMAGGFYSYEEQRSDAIDWVRALEQSRGSSIIESDR